MKIPFNRPYMTGREMNNISLAHANGALSGNGPFSKRCHQWLVQNTTAQKALLSHSCTAALEMAAILLNIEQGEEIILPSYTFVSTANAFVLRGAVPVFVDIRPDTLCLNEELIEGAITPRTKAIVPVHYAGVSCEMDRILAIASKHGLRVVEDAAQGLMSSYHGRPLGGIGDLGTLSFHETKNVICGEGGALLVNHPDWIDRAEIIWEKGTDRARFFSGQVDKYTWQDIGSSFLPGELIAAFLWAQMEEAEAITAKRMAIWDAYHALLAPLETEGLISRPQIPNGCRHNAHMYYVLIGEECDRDAVLTCMHSQGIGALFHYVPLHSSPAGQRFGRSSAALDVTESIARRVIRLPLWIGMTASDQEQVVAALRCGLNDAHSTRKRS